MKIIPLRSIRVVGGNVLKAHGRTCITVMNVPSHWGSHALLNVLQSFVRGLLSISTIHAQPLQTTLLCLSPIASDLLRKVPFCLHGQCVGDVDASRSDFRYLILIQASGIAVE